MPKWGRTRMRFVGEDGSLGYRTGRTYYLRITRAPLSSTPVTIRRRSGFGLCPYASEEAFRANWQPVSDDFGSHTAQEDA